MATTPVVPDTPNTAPSAQPNLFRGLLSGALLGLAGAAHQSGPTANAAGQIGAGIGGVIGGEQQNFQNKLAQTGAQQRNVGLEQEQQRLSNEQQRVDIERSTALVQKLHLESLIQHMNVQDRLDTLKTYTDQSELYKKNGAVSMGEVAPEDVAKFYQSHPSVKPGDIHPNPVEFDPQGNPTRYEMLNVAKTVLPAGTKIHVGGEDYTLSAPMDGSRLDSAVINDLIKTGQEKVAGAFRVQAAAVAGQYSVTRTNLLTGAKLTVSDLSSNTQYLKTLIDARTKLQVAGQNAEARNPILTSVGVTPSGNPNADQQQLDQLIQRTTQENQLIRQNIELPNAPGAALGTPNGPTPLGTSKFDPSQFPVAQ